MSVATLVQVDEYLHTTYDPDIDHVNVVLVETRFLVEPADIAIEILSEGQRRAEHLGHRFPTGEPCTSMWITICFMYRKDLRRKKELN